MSIVGSKNIFKKSFIMEYLNSYISVYIKFQQITYKRLSLIQYSKMKPLDLYYFNFFFFFFFFLEKIIFISYHLYPNYF